VGETSQSWLVCSMCRAAKSASDLSCERCEVPIRRANAQIGPARLGDLLVLSDSDAAVHGTSLRADWQAPNRRQKPARRHSAYRPGSVGHSCPDSVLTELFLRVRSCRQPWYFRRRPKNRPRGSARWPRELHRRYQTAFAHAADTMSPITIALRDPGACLSDGRMRFVPADL
jgi:hypothetical protein